MNVSRKRKRIVVIGGLVVSALLSYFGLPVTPSVSQEIIGISVPTASLKAVSAGTAPVQ